ncbi:hypothetical protein ANO11243_090370 [Dothideomycetidae sp. 11243]|nr:hypothetical protein ANO11243_090370 [fungal sp. No.11243]
MGVDTRKPPLPAPTEDPSSMDNETDLATDLSRRTDRTSYSIPEDGSPITISTAKTSSHRDGKLPHGRHKSQTSLLIEYFEAGKMGDKSRAKPSVRVKVTPSAARRSKNGSDAVQITGIGKDRKPSYTRRISLGSKSETVEKVVIDGTEMSRSTDSNVSGRPPIEVEVLDPNASDLSTSRNSRDLRYLEHSSDISSMPPDSLLETTARENGHGAARPLHRKRSRSLERQEVITSTHLDAPGQPRTRSLSRERITQKVMEKLAGRPLESSSRKTRNVEYEPDTKPSKERRRRSSRSQQNEELVSPGSSQLSSNITASQTSYRSGTSKVSLNNPRLLEMVEDTVKRLILPELHQMRREQKTSRNMQDFDEGRRVSATERDSYYTDLHRSVSKSSSTPNIRGKPKVVLNRYDDDPGKVLSRGDSERRRRSSRDESDRRKRRSSTAESVEDEQSWSKEKSDHKFRNAAAGAIAGGVLTAAALRHHHDQNGQGRSRSRGTHNRTDIVDGSSDRLYGESVQDDRSPHRHEEATDGLHETTRRFDDDRMNRRGMSKAAYLEDVYEGDSRRGHDQYDGSAAGPSEDIYDGVNHRHHHKLRLPFTGGATESDITRASIMSASTERANTIDEYEDIAPPLRQVSRGTVRESKSRATSESDHTLMPSHGVGFRDSNQSISEAFDHQAATGKSTPTKKTRLALTGAAAGVAGAALAHHLTGHRSKEEARKDYDGFETSQSVSNRADLNDPLIPAAVQNQSSASELRDRSRITRFSPSLMGSSGLEDKHRTSPLAPAADSFAARSKRSELQQATDDHGGEYTEVNDTEDWLQHEREMNHRSPDRVDSGSIRHISTGEKQTTGLTEDSISTTGTDRDGIDRDVQNVATKTHYVLHPVGVESAVASLIDPSTLSSHASSSVEVDRSSPFKSEGLMRGNITNVLDPIDLEMAQMTQAGPSSHDLISPKGEAIVQRDAKRSPHNDDSEWYTEGGTGVGRPTSVLLSANNGLPDPNDPIPEFEHIRESSSDTASILDNPTVPGSAGTSRQTISRKPVSSPRVTSSSNTIEKSWMPSHNASKSKTADLAVGGMAAGVAAGVLAASQGKERNHLSILDSAARRATVGDVDEDATEHVPEKHARPSVTPTNAQVAHDEGYVSGAYARSVDTPKAHMPDMPYYFEDENGEYDDMMEEEDPFLSTKRAKVFSGLSQGMQSPLYDSATGRGIDRIQSKDVVALMDHLTVRDGQRNARDTEILVTLVQSAAEMRQNFEELKKFIAEQDREIMRTTERSGDATAQKVLNGTSAQAYSRSTHRSSQPDHETESFSGKRQNVFKRALKGLSGRSNNDIGRMEDMLMQLLEDVETLKQAQQVQARSSSWDGIGRSIDSGREDDLSSYEALRAHTDSAGYEPEGLPGTGSTPTSGNFKTSPPSKQTFHSGYDGRRDSLNRVSTVMEGDEDDDGVDRDEQMTPRPMDNLRYASPAVDERRRGMMFDDMPPVLDQPRADSQDVSNDKQRKHTSTGSSILSGNPKVSRWSKTTTSSVPDGYDSRRHSQEQRPLSYASNNSANAREYQDEERSVNSRGSARAYQHDLKDTEAASDHRSLRSYRTGLTRTPSPLIPSEASISDQRGHEEHLDLPMDEDDFDDPKYSAVRNSLLLEHPQPRPGPTYRHQSNLESQARDFDPSTSSLTGSDLSQRSVESEFDPSQWGSNPALSLARAHKLGRINPPNQSGPAQSPTESSPRSTKARVDDGPLFPIQRPEPLRSHDPANDRLYQRSQAAPRTFDRLYYSSPLGSGHLLEPIEEVRYSLETDRASRMSPDRELTPEPQPKVNRARLNPVRKITGPRPMVRNVSGSKVEV